MDINVTSLKGFFKSWSFWRPALGVLIGATAGFMYYFLVGCKSGTCPISGNPFMSTIWGGLMGFFLVSSPCARNQC